jgi:hypothetical protein
MVELVQDRFRWLPFELGVSTFGLKCLRLKCDGTRAETRFRLSAKRTSPFKSAGASVQSTTGSRGVRISGSNAGYTMFRGSVRVPATHSIRQFPLHFPSRASSCAITFQLDSTTVLSDGFPQNFTGTVVNVCCSFCPFMSYKACSVSFV